MRRRAALLALVSPFGAATPGRAQPAGISGRPIRVVQPFPPGGAVDAWARLVAEGLSPRLQVPVVVESRSGATGLLAAEHVARSVPDGTTLLLTTDILIQAPLMLGRSPIDPIQDLAPIGRIGHTTLTFVVGPAVPAEVTTMPQFLAWAAGRPVVLAHTGGGSPGFMVNTLLIRSHGLDAAHIGYRGEPPMVPDLLAGRFHGAFVTTITFGELIRTGRVRPLATVGPLRLPSLDATVPNMQELGLLQDYAYRSFIGLFGPRGMPAETEAALARALRETLADPAIRQRLVAFDTFPGHEGPAEFAVSVATAQRNWIDIMAMTGVAPPAD